MPIPFAAEVYYNGWPAWLPAPMRLAQFAGSAAALTAVKMFFGGATCTAERDMHGRVVMMTGGTSGIGAVVALELAKRGAHVVLLTPQPPSDPFVVDYVEELRARADNQMVYAEHVDLASLHSIRSFATKWIDNLPVRRLDMVILCAAAEAVPVEAGGQTKEEPGQRGSGEKPEEKTAKRRQGGGQTAAAPALGKTTAEGIERAWMVNYLGNFHLLGMLSPALRSQQFDRDVRVIITTCSAYIGSPPLVDRHGVPANLPWTPQRAYARSKLALMVFARAFQKHVDAYQRPDGLPGNVRVLLVDPGFSRTPGFRRWLTGGSLTALLLVYVLFYPLWWLLVKSAEQGAQSVLFAAMEGALRQSFGNDDSENKDRATSTAPPPLTSPPTQKQAPVRDDPLATKLIKECRLVDQARRDISDEAVGKALWEDSDRLVEETEKRAAVERQRQKKAQEDADKAAEIASLLDAIKKGKEKEKQKKMASGDQTRAPRKKTKGVLGK